MTDQTEQDTPTKLANVAFGLHTFGDLSTDLDGKPLSQAQSIRNLVDQAVLADQLGIDAFGVGEHHRPDFAVSSPETVLAGIATKTERILLATAVTVLSSDDPVRVFQRFSTVDALSNGRAEAIVGRGSFTESFPLFGYDLSDYEVLFEEKFDLFLKLVREDSVSWQGTTRAALNDVTVHPRIENGQLRTWVAVGGSPQSVVRAAQHEVPLMLAIIGGAPERFEPFTRLYRTALEKLGGDVTLPIGVHSPGHIADTDEEAREQIWPHYETMNNSIGRDRGWMPVSKGHFREEIEYGSLYVGAPETVAQKIAKTVQTLGLERFDLKYVTGTQPHEQLMHSIELYGKVVVPRVRELLKESGYLA